MIAGDACGKVQAASAQSSEASFALCAVYLEEVRGQATLAEAELLTGRKFGAVSLHPRIVSPSHPDGNDARVICRSA